MNSIFTNIYKYRQTDKKNEIENYLIEIFSDCLRKDEIFKNTFLNKIGFENIKADILTQKTFTNGKRPDICIEDDKNLFLVECKVGADEGNNQLTDYQQILFENKNKKSKLVFLTKYIIQNNEADICLTWSDIADIISDKNNLLTTELKTYLLENKIAFMKNFTKNNFEALYHIRETIQKMDIVLNSVKKDYKQDFEFAQTLRSQKLLTHSAYYDQVKLSNNKILDIGFFGFDTDKITVGVRFFAPDKTEIINLENQFKDWTKFEWDTGAWLGCYKIINSDEVGIEECVSFINKSLSEIRIKSVN